MSTTPQPITSQTDPQVASFASKIRARFPGAYDDLKDDELATKIVTKHPEYSDMLPKGYGQNNVNIGSQSVNLKTGQGAAEASTAQAQKIGTTPPVDKADMSQPHTNLPGASFGYMDQPLFRKALEHGKGNEMGKDVLSTGAAIAAPELLPEIGGAGIGGALTRIGTRAIASGLGGATGSAIGQSALQHQNPLTTPNLKESARTGATMGVLEGAGSAIGEGLKALPNAARAGKALGEVRGTIEGNQVPVTSKLSDSTMRIKELADAGSTMPQAARKFMMRVTDPDKPPLSFDVTGT